MKKFILTFLFSYCLAISAATFYVSNSGTSTASGTSWENATSDLQAAIEACANAGGGEVWVERGTYIPRKFPNEGLSQNERAVHFSLRNKVKVLGGFLRGAKNISERNFIANKTVLSADLQSDDLNENLENPQIDNAYSIFFHPKSANLNSTAVLDGFELSGGYACVAKKETSSFMENLRGGAIHNSGSSPTIKNCTFTNNCADDIGGGIYNFDSESVIENCIFELNKAYSCGGAISNVSSNVKVLNCSFAWNTAQLAGAAFSSKKDFSTFVNCTFFENFTSLGGGAVYSQNQAKVDLRNCTFASNSTPVGGNSVDLANASLTAKNSLFTSDGEQDIFSRLDSTSTLSYCFTKTLIEGNGNISGEPLIGEYATYASNIPTIPALRGSPLISAGKDGELLDARGMIRSAQCTIGAYEFIYGANYENWIKANGLTGENEKPEAILHADNITNLEKFIFGLNPTRPASYAENPYFKQTTDGTTARFEFPVNKDIFSNSLSEFAINAVISKDLKSWQKIKFTKSTQTDNFNIYHVECAIPTDGKLFFKIDISQ